MHFVHSKLCGAAIFEWCVSIMKETCFALSWTRSMFDLGIDFKHLNLGRGVLRAEERHQSQQKNEHKGKEEARKTMRKPGSTGFEYYSGSV